ncbi:hypothetical protein Rumeso_02863 [Rubellimicrobium mesophilum DSM 19309]|uniref:Uncharacterized protein n=1 Tax=Rubellimicrobium mesophilum DSM 19309 TaxID=442562 RepID=A0A017HM15_9RHOB|nr:hypothetical protein [Rubellimicrobium mesophilum]EYD75517.1 hypothetical protein Rumeso_02863 [Rubellimicrobium mesophilum DSM 19309]
MGRNRLVTIIVAVVIVLLLLWLFVGIGDEAAETATEGVDATAPAAEGAAEPAD